MFAGYLHSIEQLLDARRWEVALREARDLPRIAVALADPHLRGSSDSIRTWCQEWIRPPGAERDAHGLQYERLAQQISDRVAPLAESEPVPMRALRRLQLARNLRSRPQSLSRRRVPPDLSPREAEALESCSVLLDAARRWYARRAVSDRTTQTNLARLAVFR
jgi:hypothetical protein